MEKLNESYSYYQGIEDLEQQIKILEKALSFASVDLLVVDGKSYLPESKEIGVAGQDRIIYEHFIKQAKSEFKDEKPSMDYCLECDARYGNMCRMKEPQADIFLMHSCPKREDNNQ